MVDQIKKLHRAGGQRLEAAELLYHGHGRILDGLYLGGYCIECTLKVLILTMIPRSKRDQYLNEHFRGNKPHKFDWLQERLRIERGPALPESTKKQLRMANLIWSTDLRYETGSGGLNDEEVRAVLDFARDFWNWTKGHIP